MLRSPIENITSYDCNFRSVTQYEGKRTETVMRYSFQKPDKVRMDIASPRKGAVVLYNPAVSPKVRVRPFPAVKAMVLSYDLSHKRVSSGPGGTIDKSHLGARVEQACANIAKSPDVVFHPERNPKEIEESYVENGKKHLRRYVLSPEGFIAKIETRNDRGEMESLSEWTDLKINPVLNPKIFEDPNAKP